MQTYAADASEPRVHVDHALSADAGRRRGATQPQRLVSTTDREAAPCAGRADPSGEEEASLAAVAHDPTIGAQRRITVQSQPRTWTGFHVPDAQTVQARKGRAQLRRPTNAPTPPHAADEPRGLTAWSQQRTRTQFLRRGRGEPCISGIRSRRRHRAPPRRHAASPFGLNDGQRRSSRCRTRRPFRRGRGECRSGCPRPRQHR